MKTDDYSDIIDLPHHQSDHHAHMSAHARAGQFSPFAALTGFDDDIDEAAAQNRGEFDALGRRRDQVEDWTDPC